MERIQHVTEFEEYFIVDEKTKYAGVFFGNELAYAILNPNERFWDDLNMKNMKSCDESNKYMPEI